MNDLAEPEAASAIVDGLAAQVSSTIERGRHALNLIRGVPSSKEGRRLGTDIRALIGELRGAKRDLITLRTGLRAATTSAAQGAVLRHIQVQSAAIRALLAKADETIGGGASHVATSAPALEPPRTHHDRPTYPKPSTHPR